MTSTAWPLSSTGCTATWNSRLQPRVASWRSPSDSRRSVSWRPESRTKSITRWASCRALRELSLKRLKVNPTRPRSRTACTLQIIRDEAFRCREITSKLLNLAKGISGHARTQVSLATVVRDVVAMIKAHPKYRGQRIVDDVGVDELFVSADPSEMTQVLLNLITNAMDAVEHTAAGEVRISAESSGEGVELFVEDNGCGMSPDVRDRDFEPFFSARRGDGQARGGVGWPRSHTRSSKAMAAPFARTATARDAAAGS